MLLWEETEDLELRDQAFRSIWGRDASCLGGGLILSPSGWEGDFCDPPVRIRDKAGVVPPVDTVDKPSYTMVGSRQVQGGVKPSPQAKAYWPIVLRDPDTP